ncbi:MAG: hypothetical protein OEU50_04280 [Gammaproteobacteria bacterium]|nr:hypothetical protein [Gammaproteobacteria bacterium]
MAIVRGFAVFLLFFQILLVEWGFLLVLSHGMESDSLVYINPLQGLLPFLITVALWLIAAPKKSTVLFLRHFGDSHANELVTRSIYGALRRHARLVVLDDSDFEPVAVPLKERVVTGGLLSIICLNIIGLILIASATTTAVDEEGPGYHYQLSGFVSVLKPGLIGTSITSVSILGNLGVNRTHILSGRQYELDSSGTFMVYSVPLGYFPDIDRGRLVFSVFQAWPLWLMLASLSLFAYRISFRSWETRRNVTAIHQIGAMSEHVTRLGSRLRAPRSLGPLATVIRSSDTCWKPLVSAMLDCTEWTVLDCSHPTDSILWELELGFKESPEKLILIRSTNRSGPRQNCLEKLLASFPHERLLQYDRSGDKRIGQAIANLVKKGRAVPD